MGPTLLLCWISSLLYSWLTSSSSFSHQHTAKSQGVRGRQFNAGNQCQQHSAVLKGWSLAMGPAGWHPSVRWRMQSPGSCPEAEVLNWTVKKVLAGAGKKQKVVLILWLLTIFFPFIVTGHVLYSTHMWGIAITTEFSIHNPSSSLMPSVKLMILSNKLLNEHQQ